MIDRAGADEQKAIGRFQGTIMISLRNVSKAYSTPAGEISALRDIDIEVGTGALIALVGRSGSGKSTLLNVRIARGERDDRWER